MKIERIPTAPAEGGYGEMDLELFGDRVRVEHRRPGFPGAPGEGASPGHTDVVYVPVALLWRLLIHGLPDFRFEELSVDELRDAIDFAREKGWSG
jgi:hypothetical protein